MTQEEKDLLQNKMSEHKYKNYVDFIFKMICTHQTVVIDTRPLMKIAGELNAIGVNINQIAKIANTTKSIYADEIERLSSKVDEMRRIIYKCFKSFCDADENRVDGIH